MAVDSAFLDEEYGEKVAQRKAAFTLALALFRQAFNKKHPERTLVYSEDSITNHLVYLYFHWSYHVVRPFVEELSDRYKIASNTEFCIIYLQPLSIADGTPAENARINAAFAFYMALNIIRNFDHDPEGIQGYKDQLMEFKGSIAPMEDMMENIIENHRRYMTTFKSREWPPIILNALVWEMIDMFYKFQWQSLAV